MINMFRAELYRLSRTKGFYIFWALSILSFMISVISGQPGGISFGTFIDISNCKTDISQLAYNFTYYYLLIMPVFGAITSEFNEQTVKNTISSAVSKKNYFIYKYVFSMIYSLISFAVLNYMYYFLNRIANGNEHSSEIGVFSATLLRQMPLFAAIISLFIFFAFLLRKGAVFNAVTILTPTVYSLTSFSLYKIENTQKFAEHLLKYELGTMIVQLTLNTDSSYMIKCYMISAVIIILSFTLGYISFTKKELN